MLGFSVKTLSAIVFSLFLLYGCGTEQTKPNTIYADNFAAVKLVDASDGINKAEAHLIARAFFWSNISGCGLPHEPEDQGRYWVSKTAIGYAGLPGDPIYVDKKTGAITWDHKAKPMPLIELKNWVKEQ